jgi:polar amino acid transport system permease protein
VSALILVVIAGWIAYTFATAPLLHWEYVQNWFFSRRILDGLVATLYLTVIAMFIGVGLGILLAVMRLSPNPVVSSFGWMYVWLFRGTPILVQLLLWNNISIIFQHISIGIPGIGSVYDADTIKVVTPLVAAILGLGLNEAAYMSEIVRAGIISVDVGQTEAAQALGMTRLQTMRRVVLPQAMRVIIPPTGNETISMLKTTSLVSVIAFTELLYASSLIYSVNYKVIELLIVASIWYLIVTSVLSVGQYYVERHYARGAARELPPTPLQRLRRALLIRHVEPPGRTPPSIPTHREGMR